MICRVYASRMHNVSLKVHAQLAASQRVDMTLRFVIHASQIMI